MSKKDAVCTSKRLEIRDLILVYQKVLPFILSFFFLLEMEEIEYKIGVIEGW